MSSKGEESGEQRDSLGTPCALPQSAILTPEALPSRKIVSSIPDSSTNELCDVVLDGSPQLATNKEETILASQGRRAETDHDGVKLASASNLDKGKVNGGAATILKNHENHADLEGDVNRMGPPIQFLGLSVKGRKMSATSLREDGIMQVADEHEGKKTIDLEVNALKDGVLDMYSYHRGREGMEPRDPETGELLCGLEVTDSNHDWDVPKTTVSVTVEFPLDDDEGNSESAKESGGARFKETISWDLGDASNPTPQTFALNIAKEFGLSFGQMIDLALSIQQQLEAHIVQNCAYVTPIASKDPTGADRRAAPVPVYTHRYGEVLETGLGGVRLTKKEMSKSQQKLPMVNPRQNPNPTAAAPASQVRRKVDRAPEPVLVYQGEEVEVEFRNEIIKRSKAASAQSIAEGSNNGLVGLLKREKDYHCHICHKRCDVAFLFACGIQSHAFCETHCRVSYEIGPLSYLIFSLMAPTFIF